MNDTDNPYRSALESKGYFVEQGRTPFPTQAIGHNAVRPSGHSEYDALTGYVTGNYVSEWQDKNGTRWRTVTTIINLGKPDRGHYTDPDRTLNQREELDAGLESTHHWRKAVQASMDARIAREAQLLVDMRAVLRKQGPMSVQAIRGYVNADKARVLRVLRSNRDVFRLVGGMRGVWGLHGQHYEMPKVAKHTRLMLLIRECLVAHGPQSAPEIAKRLGKKSQNVTHSLSMCPEWFEVKSIRPAQGQAQAARVWGLVEAA